MMVKWWWRWWWGQNIKKKKEYLVEWGVCNIKRFLRTYLKKFINIYLLTLAVLDGDDDDDDDYDTDNNDDENYIAVMALVVLFCNRKDIDYRYVHMYMYPQVFGVSIHINYLSILLPIYLFSYINLSIYIISQNTYHH